MTLSLAELFVSRDQFARLFADGLTRLLLTSTPEARHAVLAYNNAVAIGDADLLSDALEAARLVLAHPPAFTDPNEPDDRRILAQALAGPAPRIAVGRTPAGRLIVDNPLRRQRPLRAAAIRLPASATGTGLWRPFDPAAFSFQRLPREYMADAAWDGLTVRLHYNKYPSGPWHLSLVPEPASGHPQFLTEQWLELAIGVAGAARSAGWPEMVVVYNSLLARASINHCHFQLLEIPGFSPYASLCHAGCTVPRPGTVGESWKVASLLQAAGQPFHLMLAADTLVVPRQPQGTVAEPAWTTGFAALELGGYVMVVHPDGHAVTDPEIDAVVRTLVTHHSPS